MHVSSTYCDYVHHIIAEYLSTRQLSAMYRWIAFIYIYICIYIYIQWNLDTTGPWLECPDKRGVLISGVS